jgi:CO/xanthine dehydrogenase FAD-binding subunit
MGLAYKRFEEATEASSFLERTPEARILGGGTLLVRRVNEGDTAIGAYVRLADLALKRMETTGDVVRLGAGVSMAQILAHPDLAFLAPVARTIGGPSVRSAATIGGNLFAPRPYGDFGVALLALGASLRLFDGASEADMDLPAFFAGRGQLPLGAIVTAVAFPRPAAQSFRFVKISRVKPKGAAVISIAAVIETKNGVIDWARIAFGAMAETPVRAQALEAALQGQALTAEALDSVLPTALQDLSPVSDAIASAWYRRAVAPAHLRRLLLPS